MYKKMTHLITLSVTILLLMMGCSIDTTNGDESMGSQENDDSTQINAEKHRFSMKRGLEFETYDNVEPMIVTDTKTGCSYLYIHGHYRATVTPLYDENGEVACRLSNKGSVKL